MLVLTRKPGESIVIGDDVVIKVLSVEGESIRIGITAPRALPSTARSSWRPFARRTCGPPFRRSSRRSWRSC